MSSSTPRDMRPTTAEEFVERPKRAKLLFYKNFLKKSLSIVIIFFRNEGVFTCLLKLKT